MANAETNTPEAARNTIAESSSDGSRQAFNFETFTASESSISNFVGAIHAQNVNIGDREAHKKRKKPDPDSTIPFRRNLKFVERKGIFNKLDAVYGEGHGRAAVYGLGGIGKSQIAIEYAFRMQEEDENIWVFWMSAISTDALVQSFRKTAQSLNLPGHEDSEAGAWLMIIDNADDVQVLHQPYDSLESRSERSLFSYVPQKSHGKVLITSRDRDTAYEAVQDYDLLIKLDHMTMEESLALLGSRVAIQSSDEEAYAQELVNTLDHIPLAISQAGAFIRHNQSQAGIKEYLKTFSTSEENQVALLNRQKSEPGRDRDVPNSVLITWAISFEKLRDRNIEAADLLCIMSMLYRQNIPLELVRIQDSLTAQQSLTTLEDYCFITVTQPVKPVLSEDERLFSLHRLIQLATVRWLQDNNELNKWRTKALLRITTVFPEMNSCSELESCQLLMLHVEEVLSHETAIEAETAVYHGILLRKLAEYHFSRRNYNVALKNASACMRILENRLDETDANYTLSIRFIARVYRENGQWDRAASLLERAIDSPTNSLGSEDSRTLCFKQELAYTYTLQGRVIEAEQLVNTVIENLMSSLGDDHSATLYATSQLGRIYRQQGRLEEAKQVQSYALLGLTKVLGSSDPSTLEITRVLSCIYVELGEFDNAERVLLLSLKSTTLELGPDHPETLQILAHLGTIYNLHGRHEKLLQQLLPAVEDMKSRVGFDTYMRLSIMQHVSISYWSIGQTDKAIELMKEIIRFRTETQGEDHSDTIAAMEILAEWRMIASSH